MAKKVVKKKVSKKTSSRISFSDLYAMYLFVSGDAQKVFGQTAPEARKIVLEKEKELKQELYKRVYGFNPFEKFKTVVEGTAPEKINLDRFVVAKNKEEEKPEEPKDKPETFVVVKNEDKEG